jgi:hypothetical protein
MCLCVVWAEATSRYRPFRGFWSELAVQDPTVMSLTLANAAIWRRQAMGELPTGVEYEQYPESARYYSRSLRSLSGVLARKPRAADVGLGVVGSILGLACHDVGQTALGRYENSTADNSLQITAENWERWAHHLNGLIVVVRLRGGLSDLTPGIAAFAAWLAPSAHQHPRWRPPVARSMQAKTSS